MKRHMNRLAAFAFATGVGLAAAAAPVAAQQACYPSCSAVEGENLTRGTDANVQGSAVVRGTGLARTGPADASGELAVAITLLAAGSGLVVVSRRRSTTTA